MIERGYTWTEEWRHQKEVEFVAQQTKEWRDRFWIGVEQKRGKAACEKLYMDTKKEWKKNQEREQITN